MSTGPLQAAPRAPARLPPSRKPAFVGCVLSPRELAAVRQLAHGLSYRQTAERLHCCTSTVRSLLHTAYARLGVSTGAQAVTVCMQAGWLDTVLHDGNVVELADRRVTWAQRLYLEAFDQFLRAGDDTAELERTRTLRDAALTGLFREAKSERPWRAMETNPLERIAHTLRRIDERSARLATVDQPDPPAATSATSSAGPRARAAA